MRRSRSQVFGSCSLLLFALIIALAPVAWAEDTDQVRAYLNLRAGVFHLVDPQFIRGVEADKFQDVYGLSLGVNINRYVGFEISGDMYEPAINFTSGTPSQQGAPIAEYKVWALVPQLRLRYPVLEGRLTPYVVGGVGVAFSQLNDRKSAAFGVSLAGSNTALAATAGAGIEYFLLNNVTLGLEAKYVYAGKHDLRVGELSGRADPSALLTTVGFRLLWPEAAPQEPGPAKIPAPSKRPRFYAQLRVGGAFFLRTNLLGNVETDTDQVGFGISLGVNLNRYLGVEIAGDTTETDVNFAGRGKFGEYALWTVTPQLRVRYPLGDGRLVPYAVAGVGLGWTEFNDQGELAENLRIDAKGTSVVGSVGVGLDRFIARNLALGLDVKYLIFGNQPFSIEGGASGDVHPNHLLTTLGIRVLFP